MTDVNTRMMDAVSAICRAHPSIDSQRACRMALDADAQLARDYHHAGDDGAVDPGRGAIAPPKVVGNTVRGVVIASVAGHDPYHAAGRFHVSQLRRLAQGQRKPPNTIGIEKFGDPSLGGGSFYCEPLP